MAAQEQDATRPDPQDDIGQPEGTGEVIHSIRTVPGADERIELVEAPGASDDEAPADEAADTDAAGDENVEGTQMKAVHDRSS